MPQPTPSRSPAASQAPELRSLPLQTRIVPVSTVNAEARTFETVWTTGAPVRRFDWATWTPYIEELSLDPAHIRMTRFDSGAPLLNTHQQWDLSSVLGVVEKAWLETGEGRSICRFSDRDEEVNAYWRDVVNGIIRNISVGYIVHRYEKIDPEVVGGVPTWRAIDWEPAEQSLVPVGADVFSGVRSLGVDPANPGAITAEQRQQLVEQLTRSVGNRSFACEIVSRNTPTQAASTAAAPSTSSSLTPAARAADSQPSRKEIPMGQEAQAGGANTATNPANNDTTVTPVAGARTEAQIRAEEQARYTGIRLAVSTARRTTQGVAGLDQAFEDSLVSRNLTLDQARSEIFARLEAHSTSTGPARSAAAIETVQDEQVQRRADMSAAVAHRANPQANKLPDSARRYRGFTLAELARRSLDEQGISTDGMGRNTIVSLAMGNSDEYGFRSLHGTSDFSIALASTVNRSLRNAYESAQRTFTRWARKGTLSDFRAATRVAVAGNLALQKVNEFGEFKRGKIIDSGETIQLATYGKVVGVTRQAVINDDLDFLSRLPAMYGRAAADFESDTVYAILKANAAMSDSVALFHATHKNLGTAGVIGETALSEARKALRLQTDPAGNNQPLNLVGKYILCGATKETEAQKNFQAVVIATKTADTNVFQNTYEIVVEPRLDAVNPLEWWLIADSSQIDTVEYSYLEGEDGLFTEQRMGFDVDGLEVKARLDFAAKAIDFRGMFKNPGA